MIFDVYIKDQHHLLSFNTSKNLLTIDLVCDIHMQSTEIKNKLKCINFILTHYQ